MSEVGSQNSAESQNGTQEPENRIGNSSKNFSLIQVNRLRDGVGKVGRKDRTG